MKENHPLSIFWFRRDLRLDDNHGLSKALEKGNSVLPIFIFDDHILDKLSSHDPRVSFIYGRVKKIKEELETQGSSLLVLKGKPEELFEKLIGEWNIASVYINEDYEPYARERDRKIGKILSKKGIDLHAFKDQVIFGKEDITKEDGDPYVVYTPYSRKWLGKLKESDVASFGSLSSLSKHLFSDRQFPLPSLNDIGFKSSGDTFPSEKINENIIMNYDKTRDYPAMKGTSRLGVHLRFGTISIRKLVQVASELNETYLGELIWREFYMMVLYHFPYVTEESFHRKYDRLEWVNDEKMFRAWCEGLTGYPMVDAGMRQLRETGYMHNRARMITASFLTKHLLTDWRWGENWFARHLLDYELASNNGGWQWAAGTGTDAAPYFRIFNPHSQAKKFDPDQEYVKRWIPEFGSDDYPDPIIDHKEARERALQAYKKVS